jgi:hypothetical protein
MLNLQLIKHIQQNGTSKYELIAETDLDPMAYQADGFVGPTYDAEAKEMYVTLFAKVVSPPAGSNPPHVTYLVPLGEANPLPNEEDILIVTLKDDDGTTLAVERIGGGSTTTQAEPDDDDRPFPLSKIA